MNFDVLTLRHPQILVEFNCLPMNFAVSCLNHFYPFPSILLFFPSLRVPALTFWFSVFSAAPPDTNAVVVLGLDLLLVRRLCEIQYAFVVNQFASIVQTGTATLAQPIQQVHITAGPILVAHRHTSHERNGESLDPP